MVCITLGVLFLLSLAGNLGEAGKWLNVFSLKMFGVGVWIFPFVLFALGGGLFFHRFKKWSVISLVGVLLIFFSLEGLFHLTLVSREYLDLPLEDGGGIFGVSASVLFRILLGDVGAGVVLITGIIIGILMAFQLSLVQFLEGVIGVIKTLFQAFRELFQLLKSQEKKKTVVRKKVKSSSQQQQEIVESSSEKTVFQIKRGEVERAKKENIQPPLELEKTAVSRPEDQDFSNWEKPSLDILENGSSEVHVPDHELHKIGAQIVEKLAHFKVGVTMDSAFVGPTVTQFALQPDETVKLNKITGLKSELALALAAESVRIEAPIPGKNLVGIEIPNAKRSTVLMKEILESNAFTSSSGTLRLCLGKDVSGDSIVEALDEMPHLLIAGSTGSGKSVGMNAFLISMLFENSPSDLRFIMVDPKRVELMPYEGIPHLLTPVITDAGKALSALRWCVSEMMRRLEEFSSVGVRNIAEYNELIESSKSSTRVSDSLDNKEGEEKNKKLPKIVIVIDELADLMMREHKKETEAMICRIAQMARAVGMHLVIATQRPSVDVITGLIKANIPTRIAFTVTSAIDSRTILDSIGAEDLLGKGDMLFTSPRLSRPKRIQGIYISGKEIERVVNHLKINIRDEDFSNDYISLDEAPETLDIPGIPSKSSGDGDDMIEEALEVIRSTGKASASLLQRRLSVGYARAARILDEMEEMGYIGPSRGAKPREIFV